MPYMIAVSLEMSDEPDLFPFSSSLNRMRTGVDSIFLVRAIYLNCLFSSTKIVILIENRCFFAQQNSNIKTVNNTIDG